MSNLGKISRWGCHSGMVNCSANTSHLAGSVLRQAELRLEDFWAANFAQPAGQKSGEEEGGPWTRAVDGVVEIMHDMLVSVSR